MVTLSFRQVREYTLQRMPYWNNGQSSLLERAEGRGQRAMRDLMAQNPVLSADEVAERLGLTPSQVREMGDARQLLVVDHNGRKCYPEFQFADGDVLKGFSEALGALEHVSNWAAFNFFVTPDQSLNQRTPLEALRSGDIALAVRASKAFGEHTAA